VILLTTLSAVSFLTGAAVVRDGAAREIPLRDLVPGDIIKLAAGDMIPGDMRLLSSKDLFVSQGSLTGESLPVEKFHDPETKEESSPTELKNTCFMGTSVESGTATAAVVTTGVQTYLGNMARSITGERVQTSFDQGLNRFTWLMMQFMAVMVPLVVGEEEPPRLKSNPLRSSFCQIN